MAAIVRSAVDCEEASVNSRCSAVQQFSASFSLMLSISGTITYFDTSELSNMPECTNAAEGLRRGVKLTLALSVSSRRIRDNPQSLYIFRRESHWHLSCKYRQRECHCSSREQIVYGTTFTALRKFEDM